MTTQQTTVEQMNRVIAEFDGWIDKSPFINGDNEKYPWFLKYDQNDRLIGDIKHVPNKYHSSWDWIMPIVEKFEQMDFGFKLCRKRVEFYRDSTKEVILDIKKENRLASLHAAIYEAILWYNSKK